MARRRRKRRKDSGTARAFVVGALILMVGLGVHALWQWATANPLLVTTTVAVLATVGGLGAVQRFRSRRAAEERRAERERGIASTDHLSGPEFEQWTARLLTRTGFRDVTVPGGSGDLGADIIARAPDGRRTVVQCKRYSKNVPSSDMQKFAGTCRNIHRAELALFITTAGFSKPARALAARVDIVLVDRDMLAAWAADRRLPTALTGGNPPRTPAA